jgi:hypothetical protein
MKKLVDEGSCTIIELTFADISSAGSNMDGDAVGKKVFSWKELAAWQTQLISSLETPMILFIDDLDMFEHLAPAPAVARSWIADILDHAKKVTAMVVYGRECVNLYRNDYGRWLTVVDLADEASQWQRASLDERAEPHLSEYLAYRAELIVKANPLTTGYSADVHGILSVTTRKSLKPQQYLFKALDSGVKCSVLGHGYSQR